MFLKSVAIKPQKFLSFINFFTVECVQSPPAFFAKRVYEAMDGAGTDDTTLIRIIVSRSEIDLGNIKQEFERIYDKTLQSFVAVSKK